MIIGDGREVPAEVTVWTAGFGVPTLAVASGLATDAQGRLVTDETLTSVSHPSIVAADYAYHAGAGPDPAADGASFFQRIGPVSRTIAEASDEDKDLLLDLKRVQAEYANYRRRTEEQREVEIARATGSVAKGLLPVLDDLDRAEKHGDLAEGSPLAAIAEKLRAVVSRLGVETYGTAGEAFDPQQHEAIFHAPNPGGVADGTILDVVLFGATGDLARRKLLPGLLHLVKTGLLEQVQIVGTSLDDIDLLEDL